MTQTLGLIAGGGMLPALTVQGMRRAGYRVACVGFSGYYEPELPALCDHFASVGIARPGSWVRRFRRWHVSQAVMLGKVRKSAQYDPMRWLRFLPDAMFLGMWWRTFRHDARPATMLRELAKQLSQRGLELMDSTQFIPECLADVGVMTARQPTPEQWADIQFGWPLVLKLNELDIGQALAISERDVVAVEAIEGTDRMIARAGELCRGRAWTLIKTPKPNHDMRLDVPTVGPDTIENLHRAGAGCLAVEARRVIIADKAQTLELAQRYRIAVVGVERHTAPGA